MGFALFDDEGYVADVATSGGWAEFAEDGAGTGSELDSFINDGWSENLDTLRADLAKVETSSADTEDVLKGLKEAVDHAKGFVILSDGVGGIPGEKQELELAGRVTKVVEGRAFSRLYSEDQPRNDKGEWTDSGGSSGGSSDGSGGDSSSGDSKAKEKEEDEKWAAATRERIRAEVKSDRVPPTGKGGRYTLEHLAELKAKNAETEKRLAETQERIAAIEAKTADIVRQAAEKQRILTEMRQEADHAKVLTTQIAKDRRAYDRATDKADDAHGKDPALESKMNAARDKWRESLRVASDFIHQSKHCKPEGQSNG